jgi:PAS domain-containing protein
MTPWHAEFRLLEPDNSVRWIECNSTPVAEADGAVIWHGALADISERKRTERELLRSQRRLAAVVSKMSDGLLVYNSAGLLSEWNPAALAMHELDHETTRSLSLDAAMILFTVSTLDGEVLPPERWPHARLMAGEVLRQLS